MGRSTHDPYYAKMLPHRMNWTFAFRQIVLDCHIKNSNYVKTLSHTSLVPGALTDISRDTRGHSFTRVEERRGEMCEKLPPSGVGYADAFPRASRDRVEHQSAGDEAVRIQYLGVCQAIFGNWWEKSTRAFMQVTLYTRHR